MIGNELSLSTLMARFVKANTQTLANRIGTSLTKPDWNKKNGAGLILWTCREGELLSNAIKACAEWGLRFDAVNDSLPEWKEYFGSNCRKIGADEYWDDKAIPVKNGCLVDCHYDRIVMKSGDA